MHDPGVPLPPGPAQPRGISKLVRTQAHMVTEVVQGLPDLRLRQKH